MDPGVTGRQERDTASGDPRSRENGIGGTQARFVHQLCSNQPDAKGSRTGVGSPAPDRTRSHWTAAHDLRTYRKGTSVSDTSTPRETPLVLLINDEEWTTRSLESILRPEGYAVLTARSGKQGLELASKVRPDLLLVDLRLPDVTGIDLCAQLREQVTIRPSTPILLFTSGPVRRQDELDALEVGAWGILTPPFDSKELLARLRPFIAAKRDADKALEACFLDPSTGFYNLQGLIRRVTELSAETTRGHRPLACLVLGPALDDADLPGEHVDAMPSEPEPGRSFQDVLLTSTRLSDVVGRVGESDFVIVAPDTDQDGAVRLAERLLLAVDEQSERDLDLARLRMRAGLYAVSGSEPDTVVPQEFLRRATAALREAQSNETSTGSERKNRIRKFQRN